MSYDCSIFPASQGAFQVFIYNADGSPAQASIVNQMGARGSDTEIPSGRQPILRHQLNVPMDPQSTSLARSRATAMLGLGQPRR